ncbi:hypothetical protein ATORI0001_0716 [Lancefieldella rimae ATCC 49626]|uniref:Uncharacterized protein n=1 Tax=Lancefieldella rimae (strain ATCC 49626 / DSM 7090 / CCUG 31168 / NBRC 15546 / VPI D140H-11A) TaxID=553184 RepID=B9CL03_LANR4|nr:hypothetical protein ATORI0001_0716 [Lancefieldella rimae ATCC 49626]
MAWQNLVLLGMAEKSARVAVGAIATRSNRATVGNVTIA